jgi:hypothetical protein
MTKPLAEASPSTRGRILAALYLLLLAAGITAQTFISDRLVVRDGGTIFRTLSTPGINEPNHCANCSDAELIRRLLPIIPVVDGASERDIHIDGIDADSAPRRGESRVAIWCS